MEKVSNLKLEIVNFLRSFCGVDFKFPRIPITNEYGNTSFPEKELPFEFIPSTKDLTDYCSIRIDSFVIKIKDEYFNTFISILENWDRNELKKLARILFSENDESVVLVPYIYINESGDSLSYCTDGVVGVNFTKIDNRFERLRQFIYTEFKHINDALHVAATFYCQDESKAKLDDVVLRFFNTNDKEPFFFLTATKIGHTINPDEVIKPNNNPLTAEEMDYYFGYPIKKGKDGVDITCKEVILKAMNRVNDQVSWFVHCKEAEKFELGRFAVQEYAQYYLIPMINTIQLKPFSIFGGTFERLMQEAESTLNGQECLPIIDKVTGDLWSLLDTIEKENTDENIKYYAIDVDSCGIYGMDNEGRPIHTVIEGKYTFRYAIERHHSSGFMESFKKHLKGIKNNRVFTHQGKIDIESIHH